MQDHPHGNHRWLRLQWAHEHRVCQADGQVVLSDESRFNFCDHDGRIRVKRYAGQRSFPKSVIERRSGRKPGVMVWGAIMVWGDDLICSEVSVISIATVHP